MTPEKRKLFKKYSVQESHSQWTSTDDWYSIEVYRIMHDGNLPPHDDTSVMWVCDFLDKRNDMKCWAENIMIRPDYGSLYLTAKRMIYSFADIILKELKEQE